MKSLLAFLFTLCCLSYLHATSSPTNVEQNLDRSKRSLFYRNDEEGMRRDQKHRHRLAKSPIFSPSPLSNMFQIHQRDGRQYGGFGNGFGFGSYGGFGGGFGGGLGGLFGGLFGGGGDYYDDDYYGDYYDEDRDRNRRRYGGRKGGRNYNDDGDDGYGEDDSYRRKKSYKKDNNYERDDSYKNKDYKSDRDGYKPYDKQDYKPYHVPSYRPESYEKNNNRNDYRQREENYRNLASTIEKNQINAKPAAIASKIEQAVAGKQQTEAVHAAVAAQKN